MSWALLKANFKYNYLIWALMTAIFFMYFAIMLSMYDPEYLDAMQQFMDMLPPGLIQAMNFDSMGTDLFSFMSGYMYGFLLFLFPMVVSIVINHRLVSSFVDSGSMAYLLSSPNSRTKIISTQIIFSLLSITMLFVVYSALALLISEAMFPNQMNISNFLLLNLYALILYFALGGIGFFFSTLFSDKSTSLSFGIGIPVAFLIFQMLSNANEKLEGFKYLTMYTLFDFEKIGIDNSYVFFSMVILIMISGVFYGVSIVIFNQKNLYL
jgi:ABC-2 type transport system permease protein